MMRSPSILSTGTLDGDLLEQLERLGIAVDVVPMISVAALTNKEDEVRRVATESDTVIFTSKNGVEAVANILGAAQPKWRVYCVGEQTRAAIEARFPECVVIASKPNSGVLATEIISRGEMALTFFCGDKRLDTLPTKMKEAGIVLREVVVYGTSGYGKPIEKQYDAVLFFSPSAVDQYFTYNELPEGKVVAIGETTATALRNRGVLDVVVAATPDKRATVSAAAKVFGMIF